MLAQAGRWLRSQLRTLLWWLSPGSPTSFSRVLTQLDLDVAPPVRPRLRWTPSLDVPRRRSW